VLDVQQLVTSEFALFARHATSVAKTAGLASRGQADSIDEDVADTLELVSFAVDGQEYALPIDRVQEIVQAPDRVTPVPNAAPKVLGVMDLRGGLLPVLSLRSVFGLPVQALAPHNRIVVITVNREGHTYLVGVVMDTVREVLRVPLALVDPLPEVVSGGGRRTEVESVCRLEDGTRLVSVLSVDSLVDAELLASLDQTTSEQPTTQEAASMAEDVGASADDRGEDELFVVFRLQNEEYCVDVDTVQEIIRVPESLVRVPKTLDCIEGLVNLRGAVLPVVDLRTRLGLERLARDERQRIVVLITGGIRTGFVVDSVAEVARVAKVDLEPAPELSQEQAKVISRVANIPAQQRMLLVLDPRELLASTQVTGLIDELEPTDAAA
jgi:purine-binding chemotaxis protein CheW